ncbi:ATM interactor [Clonorchis sinensis]|uniref:ATM interactor n=1 Tax=Clonorchis sinensis TaxID=79923 RepID=G7YLH4_CLOSI|nr:ATM interactor [Clonorchis sinensis]
MSLTCGQAPHTTSADSPAVDKASVSETSQPIQHIVIPEAELLELPLPTYCCELCGLTVKTKANLRAHHVKTHRILKNEADVAFFTKQKNHVTYVYHCPIVPCKHNVGFDAGFSTCSRLKQHYQNVHMRKTYKCERCGGLFSTPSSHAYHLRFCGNVFSCPVCSRHYSLKKHLGQHFRRTGHRPVIKPSGCSKRATSRGHQCEPVRPKRQLEPTNKIAVPPPGAFQHTQAQQSSAPILVPIIILPVPVFGPGAANLQAQPNANAALSWKPNAQTPLTLPSGFALPAALGSALSTNYLTSFLHSVTTSLAQPTYLDASDQFEALQSTHVPAPVVDTGTQTEVSVPPQGSTDAITTTSVNTCTDEDDITAFIGSLFCDASVETNFPPSRVTSGFNDPSSAADLESLVPLLPRRVRPSSTASSDPVNADCHLDFKTSSPVKLSTFSVTDEEVQTSMMVPLENVAMQTDGIKKTHVSAGTCNFPPARWVRGCSMRESLETPPPLMGNSEHARLSSEKLPNFANRPERSASSTVEQSEVLEHSIPPISALLNPQKPRNPCVSITHLAQKESQSCEYLSTAFNNSNQFGDSYFPSSQSIGLQSSPWPSSRTYSSMETQTFSDDLESWLNSVHTQTSSSVFGLASFADMAVGVDEDFLTAALATVEGDK